MLLLALLVCLSTAGLLWFMLQAVDAERYAVRQRLEESYSAQLKPLAEQVSVAWAERHMPSTGLEGASPRERFIDRILHTDVSTAVILSTDGTILYPILMPPVVPPNTSSLQGILNRLAGAQLDYSTSGVLTLALELPPDTYTALDSAGRFALLPSLLELASTAPVAPDRQSLLERIEEALTIADVVNSANWIVLAERYIEIVGGEERLERLVAAETLALEVMDRIDPGIPEGELIQTINDRIHGFRHGDVLDIYTAESMRGEFSAILEPIHAPGDVELFIRGAEVSESCFTSVVIPSPLGQWELCLRLLGPDPFEAAAGQRMRGFRLAALLGTLSILALAFLLAVSIRRQLSLARLKSDLLATVSHELRTPIASMRVLLDSLESGDDFSVIEAREYLQLISRENRRLGTLIENFLSFSRMERGRYEIEKKPLEIGEVVAESIELMGARLLTDNCQFESRLDPELPSILGDREALVVAFTNLLENAWKYTGPAKRISMSVRGEGNLIVLEVEDNGIGIPARERKRIFRRFHQVDRRMTRTGTGVGLGLAIVENVVRLHGGSVEAIPGNDSGTILRVTLPRFFPKEHPDSWNVS